MYGRSLGHVVKSRDVVKSPALVKSRDRVVKSRDQRVVKSPAHAVRSHEHVVKSRGHAVKSHALVRNRGLVKSHGFVDILAVPIGDYASSARTAPVLFAAECDAVAGAGIHGIVPPQYGVRRLVVLVLG